MIVQCDRCGAGFDDEYRTYICPHRAFPANDRCNNFVIHEEAHLTPPDHNLQYDEGYFIRGVETGKSLYSNYRWLPDLTIPMVRAIVNHLGIDANDTVLDFGCARGYTVRAFRELGYSAYGYDVSKWAVDNSDSSVREYLTTQPERAHGSTDYDWVIAKDVLEHVENVAVTVDLLKKAAVRGVLAVVPLAHGLTYDVPEYEMDVTHIHRHALSWWMSHFYQTGWSVTGQYRMAGIKDNYSQYPTGNGFIIARRL